MLKVSAFKYEYGNNLSSELKYSVFLTLGYSKWWIKQTETAACMQPNAVPCRVGAHQQAPPLQGLGGGIRSAAAAIGWFEPWIFCWLDRLFCRYSLFVRNSPPSLAGSVEMTLSRKQKEALKLDANIKFPVDESE